MSITTYILREIVDLNKIRSCNMLYFMNTEQIQHVFSWQFIMLQEQWYIMVIAWEIDTLDHLPYQDSTMFHSNITLNEQYWSGIIIHYIHAMPCYYICHCGYYLWTIFIHDYIIVYTPSAIWWLWHMLGPWDNSAAIMLQLQT